VEQAIIAALRLGIFVEDSVEHVVAVPVPVPSHATTNSVVASGLGNAASAGQRRSLVVATFAFASCVARAAPDGV